MFYGTSTCDCINRKIAFPGAPAKKQPASLDAIKALAEVDVYHAVADSRCADTHIECGGIIFRARVIDGGRRRKVDHYAVECDRPVVGVEYAVLRTAGTRRPQRVGAIKIGFQGDRAAARATLAEKFRASESATAAIDVCYTAL